MREPYLSVVIASRNDEHGGNTLQRTQVTLDSLLEQLESNCIESELILIDWNPPIDKLPLKEVVRWPSKLKYCIIRIITVPSKYSSGHAMKAIVANNVGIRRARGRFVLPSTIDSLYSNELMMYIASRKLEENKRYRIDRSDVGRNVVQYSTIKERLDYCKENVIKVNTQAPYIVRLVLYHGLPKLHSNACGDFQLMSKHYWHLLRAYAEAESISAHNDTLLSYASYVAGVQEVILESPMYLYHIDHDDKFNDRVKRTTQLPLPFVSERLRHVLTELAGFEVKSSIHGTSVLDSSKCRRMCRDMIAGQRSYVFNDGSWGLGQEVLEEYVINEH